MYEKWIHIPKSWDDHVFFRGGGGGWGLERGHNADMDGNYKM